MVNYTDLLSPDIYRAKDGPAPPPGTLMVEPSEPVDPVEPIGPADALVKLELIYETTNPCQGDVESKARELAARYAPNVRLELLPWFAEGTEERAEEIDADCILVLLISSTPDEDGRETEDVMFIGPTDLGDWSWDEVAGLVEARLADAGIEPSSTANRGDAEDAENDQGSQGHGNSDPAR